MAEPSPSVSTCTFCNRPSAEVLKFGDLEGPGCLACAVHLGRLLAEAPELLVSVWPQLAEDDDDGSPEPRVRLPDGRSVEIRERTAELKRELPVEKRVELAELYGEIGMPKEQVMEAGYVLSTGPEREIAQRAIDVLFTGGRASPDAVSVLRRHLLPC